MKKLWLIMQIAALFTITLAVQAGAASAAAKPKDIFAKKYPNEIIKKWTTADLNLDKKPEHLVLSESGNFYLINSKGAVVLVNTGIVSDEGFGEARIQVYSVNKGEKHVAVAFEFGPSNTQLYVYRLKNNGLSKSLELMGDEGIQIDGKGKIHMYWKKYKEEGGWDPAEAVYTWNSKTLKYKGTGILP